MVKQPALKNPVFQAYRMTNALPTLFLAPPPRTKEIGSPRVALKNQCQKTGSVSRGRKQLSTTFDWFRQRSGAGLSSLEIDISVHCHRGGDVVAQVSSQQFHSKTRSLACQWFNLFVWFSPVRVDDYGRFMKKTKVQRQLFAQRFDPGGSLFLGKKRRM